MINFIKNAIVSAIIAFIVVALFYLYFPLSWIDWLQQQHLRFGSTITTIQGSDTLSNSRTTINTNFANLNTDKLENGNSTSLLTIASSTLGIFQAGSITATSTFSNTGTATSTFLGGISTTGLSLTKGINIASGFGALNSLSTATSSFANGINLTGGNLTLNGNSLLPLNLTQSNIWTALQSFSYTATSTWSKDINSGGLIAGQYLYASSTTATSTFNGGTVMSMASTTNLTVSGTCIGCASNGQEIITNTGAGPTTQYNTGTVNATCTGNKKVVGGGGNNTATGGAVGILGSYPSNNQTWTVIYIAFVTSPANTITSYAICVNP